MQTIAERIAAIGRHSDVREMASKEASQKWFALNDDNETVNYEFSDGSVLVFCGDNYHVGI